MAAAAVVMAEDYQHGYRQAFWVGLRWFVLIVTVAASANVVLTFAEGAETAQYISSVLVALTFLVQLLINPKLWPKNVARSLEASRAVVGSDESRDQLG